MRGELLGSTSECRFILTILNQSFIRRLSFSCWDAKSKWRVSRCRCEEILLCFQDNTTWKQPLGDWVQLKIMWVLVPWTSGNFKMASSARGKLARILPSFLHTRAYCNAAAMENYLYHPKSRPLEPEVQTLNLTKTINMGDIPSCLQDTFVDPSTKEAMMSKFRQNIIQTRLLNFEGEVATRDMCALPLMQNMLRVVWSYTNW